MLLYYAMAGIVLSREGPGSGKVATLQAHGAPMTLERPARSSPRWSGVQRRVNIPTRVSMTRADGLAADLWRESVLRSRGHSPETVKVDLAVDYPEMASAAS